MIGRSRKRRSIDPARLFPIVGVAAIAILAVAVYISYTANLGIPGQRFYQVWVNVPDANRLVKSNEVRIAGYRVGFVAKVEGVPQPANSTTSRPYARALLKLQSDQPKLPVDTVSSVRPASVLGATYLSLEPGRSRQTIKDGGTLALSQGKSTVQLTDLLDLFDPRTAKALQGSVTSLGDGLAGRGTDLGTTVTTAARLAPVLQSAMASLADPSARLGPFFRSVDQAVSAVNARRDDFAAGFTNGERTFAALDRSRDALGRTIDVLPGAAQTTTRSLARLRPALDNLADISAELRPGARVLPGGLRTLNDLLAQAIPTFKTFRTTAPRLQTTAGALRTFAEDPGTTGAIRKLGTLFEVGAPFFKGVGEAQINCNVVSMFSTNLSSVFADAGSGRGPGSAHVRFKGLGAGIQEIVQNGTPLPQLHSNYLPNENAQECEANNEPYDKSKQVLRNPKGLQGKGQVQTFIPAGLTDQAKKVGLLDTPPPAVKR